MLSGVVAPCPFERSILRGCAACAQSEKIQIAERELVKCRNTASHSRCSELYAHLRRSFSFALGTLRVDTPLPHAQEMRVQCGGLKGLQHTLSGGTEVENVDELLENAPCTSGAKSRTSPTRMSCMQPPRHTRGATADATMLTSTGKAEAANTMPTRLPHTGKTQFAKEIR